MLHLEQNVTTKIVNERSFQRGNPYLTMEFQRKDNQIILEIIYRLKDR